MYPAFAKAIYPEPHRTHRTSRRRVQRGPMSRITGPRYNLHPSTEAHVQAGILVSTRGALAASGFTSPILGIVISHRQGGSTIQSSLIHTAGDHSATTLAPFFPADEEHSRCTRLPEQLRRSIHRPQDPHWPSHRGCYTRTANKLTHTTLRIATDVFGKGTNLQAAGSKA